MDFRMNRFISWIIVAVILTLTTSVFNQEPMNQIVDGPCSRFQVGNQQPFIETQFMGSWYVYATYNYDDVEGLDCLVALYHMTPDGTVINNERGKNLKTNERKEFQENYYFNRPGVGHYVFEEGPDAENIDIPVADYTEYYIEFSCTDLPDGKSDSYIGIYTRSPFPGPLIVNRINEYLNAHNIDRTKLRYINHDEAKCIL